MKSYPIKNVLIVSTVVICLATLSFCSKTSQQDTKMISKVYDTQSIASLFNLTVEDIKNRTPEYIDEAQKIIDAIIIVPDEKRTFENTAQPLDELVALSNLAIALNIYHALELLSPVKEIRDVAHEMALTIQAFLVDAVTTNKKLYHAFVAYAAKNDELEKLSAQQRYFINDVIDSFKREGLSLPDETLAQISAIRKELARLSAEFERNIANDNRFITVKRVELEGLDDDFINALKKTEDGLYILGIDYPTYFRVMENCSVEQPRKSLYDVFNNRAYPINEDILKIETEPLVSGYEDIFLFS